MADNKNPDKYRLEDYADLSPQEADQVGPETGKCGYCGQQAGLGVDGLCRFCRSYHAELGRVLRDLRTDNEQ